MNQKQFDIKALSLEMKNQRRMLNKVFNSTLQICTFLTLTFLCVCNLCAQSPVDVNRKFTPEELIKDVDFYVKTVEETHVKPFVHISRNRWRKQADQIKLRIAQQGAMTQQEFWLLFAPLVSSIQDRHSVIVEPRFFIPNNPTKYLPVRAVYVDGKVVVTSSVADLKIPKGAVITSVNGIESNEIVRKLSSYVYGVEKERIRGAAEWLWIGAAEVYGKPESFLLTFADGTKQEVKGLTVSEIINRERAASVNQPKASDSPLVLKFLDKDIAYLNASTFEYDLEKYKAILKDIFTQIKASGARNLIIDLRSNTGGNSTLGNALINMFNRKSIKHYSSKWKRSIQYAEELKSDGAPIPNHYLTLNPGEFYVSKAETVNPTENPLRFNGQVYVLSSKETFSSGQMFLGLVKDNKLAKIIGEETSTPACFPGEHYRFNLPNSRLRVMTSVKYWMTPGGCKSGRGVVPDVMVTERLEDYLTGRDRILETALSSIKRKR
ncbi:MAG TPA: S41 family peptidase [Pyrinomonadaceae bacterium]